jgi:hypothetical protein
MGAAGTEGTVSPTNSSSLTYERRGSWERPVAGLPFTLKNAGADRAPGEARGDIHVLRTESLLGRAMTVTEV